MKYIELKKELAIKERTINDISRYISNIHDNNPNYCLLLGAGCSVTSGINSGGSLVEKWRQEVYEMLFPEDSYDADKAKQKLSSEYGAWYDLRNEYSSLFEKKFDLPRQRRMFVEREVSGRKPSIGYAYLIRLIESSFFNTVFTTNFDDLLNEAFNIYSEKRPICCAHDSAINSITVTSKRPKIIKLHGDFLFDDIKSTLRENRVA